MNSSIQDIDALSMALIGRKEVCNHSKYDGCVNVTKHILLKSRGGKKNEKHDGPWITAQQ